MKKILIILVIFLVAISIIFSIYIYNSKNKNNDKITVYNYEPSYEIEYEDKVLNIIENTVIKGVNEINHNGFIYIFNGQHFGEYGFEMEEYTSTNIDIKNQNCIDYITSDEYDTTYINEGDILICTGDLTIKQHMNDFDTKDNAIVVLKSDDFNKMKKEVIEGKKEAVITIGEFFDDSNQLYLKYNISDGKYELPFALEININDEIDGIEALDTTKIGKKVKVQYKDSDVALDELELKSIEIIND